MREDISVVQRVYEYVVRAGRVVRTREIVAAVGGESVSAVTFALTRLVREGNLERVGYAAYRVAQPREGTPSEPRLRGRLVTIFETIRPVLSFEDLTFLYTIVLAAQRLAPDLFEDD